MIKSPILPTAAVIPVFITGQPIIKNLGGYNTFNISAVVLKDNCVTRAENLVYVGRPYMVSN